jgi:hypothetical protein
MEVHKYESIRANARALEDIRVYEDACREAAELCSKKVLDYARNAETLALVASLQKAAQEHRRLSDWCKKQSKTVGTTAG